MNTEKERRELEREANRILAADKRRIRLSRQASRKTIQDPTKSKAKGKGRRLSPASFTSQSTSKSRARKREFTKHLEIHRTPCERELEKRLEMLHGKWHSQKLIFGWIVDFWSFRLQMIIEVDGGYHSTPEQAAKDAYRDRVMGSYGIRTLRIKNEEIENSPDSLMDRLKRIISVREVEIGRRVRGFAGQLIRRHVTP